MKQTKTKEVRCNASLLFFNQHRLYMQKQSSLLLILLLFFCQSLTSQQNRIQPRWMNGFWTAKWIACPNVSGLQYGVYHFRKTWKLTEKPERFVIHVSGDNRYRLFVNGKSIGSGPARSDLANWNFETYDIAPYLQEGENCIAATVWNFAEYRPYAQFSLQTAFIVQGNTDAEQIVNTNASWKVFHNKGYAPLPIDKNALRAYIVVAQGEKVDAGLYPWDFTSSKYDDHSWPSAEVLWYAAKSKRYGTDGNWQLVPRSIPMEEEREQYFSRIVTDEYRSESSRLSRDGKWDLVVPAGKKISILIDQSMLTNAYPHISLSGGKNAVITLSYAEALFDAKGNKGHRDSTRGKTLKGISDVFIMDGGDERVYSPLYYRTFRYLKLDIQTADQPLNIRRLWSVFTGYPFQEVARFSSDKKWLDTIWTIGWRTARLCAADTYMDCPYYEQLQYVGDTRIQSLISLYVSGDVRLMKKAIDDISHSFIPEGLTQSRYPCYDLQVIPTFSLWWVNMIHDLWMHRKEDTFVKGHLNGIRSVLGWYDEKMAPDHLLGPLSWWQFTDWSWPWKDSIELGGVPPGVSHGGSVVISLQYAYALKKAAELMQAFGNSGLAEEYRTKAEAICTAVYRLCWDSKKGCLADTREMMSYSQHANILAILTDAVPKEMQSKLIDRIINDATLTKATYYFTFYLFEALEKTNQGQRFLEMLGPWNKMVARGLTTFAEEDDPTRSDCHAWSASPDYELLSLVCGIRPIAPGFSKVRIKPEPGDLKYLNGSVPHPSGNISLQMKKKEKIYDFLITMPKNTDGLFIWKGKEYPLYGGEQQLSLE